MATRRKTSRRKTRRRTVKRKDDSKLRKAKEIVRTMTSRGAIRSGTVQAAVVRAGISVRTYRTARKALGTKAMRVSRSRVRRGTGKWYAKHPSR